MPAVLTEHTQFTDAAGKPFVNGKVYFGVQGADPTVSPITIYSDRELTTPITNPQALDAFGRTANKVWVSGRYSIRVDDLNDVQKYQNLDNGESADKGITVLENVSGANTITATAATTINAYEDLEQYAFRTAQVNTDAVTLNIDTVGAKAVVKNHDQPILPGEFEADQNVVVSYNETDDVFEWVNQNNKVVDFYEGTDVATATQPDIWVTDGNTFHFTGSVTVVDLANAPSIGARRTAIADAAFPLTHGSGITLEGGANIEIAIGDRIEFYADALDAFSAWVTKADGTAVAVVAVGPFSGTPTATTSGTEHDYLSIPSGTKRITVMFDQVSKSGTSPMLVQIGDAGGIEATGYTGSGDRNAGATNSTAGYIINATSADDDVCGNLILTLLDSATFTWTASGALGRDSAVVFTTGGSKSLSAELDRIRLTTVGGTDTFDGGKFNILYD